MVDEFEKKYILSKAAATPASIDLFGKNEDLPKLDMEMFVRMQTSKTRHIGSYIRTNNKSA